VVNAGSATTAAITADDTNEVAGIELVVNGNVALNADYETAAAPNTDNTLAISATKASTVTYAGEALTKVVATGSAVTLKGVAADFTGASMTGLSQLTITTNTGGLDLDQVSSSTKVSATSAGAALSITEHDGQAVSADVAALDLTVAAKTSGSKSIAINLNKDTPDVTFTGMSTASVVASSAVKTITELTYSGTTTLTIAGDTTVTKLGQAATTDTIAISGSGDLTVDTGAADIVSSVNASGISGGLTLKNTDVAATISGGAGNDVLTLANVTTATTVKTGGGDDSVTYTANTTGKFNVDLGDGKNTLTINLDLDTAGGTVTGGAGIDTIDIVEGDVAAPILTMSLGGGDDVVKLGSTTAFDNDATTQITIDFGDGVDTLTLYNSTDIGVAAAFTTGFLTLTNLEKIGLNSGATVTVDSSLVSGKGYTISGDAAGTEELVVKSAALVSSIDLSTLTVAATVNKVTINASSAAVASTINGTGAADNIVLSTKGDTVSTGAGKDTVTGAAGNDTISLGDGVDSYVTLATYALNGKDTVTLGAGADVVDFDAMTAPTTDGDLLFTITDFVGGTGGDLLQFKETVFDAYDESDSFDVATKTMALILDAALDNSTGTTGTNYVIVDTTANILTTVTAAGKGLLAIASDTGAVYYDDDGDFSAGAIQFAKITITGTLTGANFDAVP